MRACVLAGAILCASAILTPHASANDSVTYGYDALGRLIQTTHTGTVNNGLPSTYSYDTDVHIRKYLPGVWETIFLGLDPQDSTPVLPN